MSAELNARRTAAAAVLADFGRWADGATIPGDWESWSQRLAAALLLLVDQLGHETPGPLEMLGADAVVRQLGQIRLVLDVLDWHDAGLFQDALEQIDDILRGER